MEFCAVYANAIYATILYSEESDLVIFVMPNSDTRTFSITETREFDVTGNKRSF